MNTSARESPAFRGESQIAFDGPPLPEMREAVLSHDEVSILAADLQAYTQIASVICKSRSQQHVPPQSTPLSVAVDQLFARTVTAVQIRYAYDGHEWTDTLLHAATGTRLVRCQHADTGARAPSVPT